MVGDLLDPDTNLGDRLNVTGLSYIFRSMPISHLSMISIVTGHIWKQVKNSDPIVWSQSSVM